MSKSFRVSAVCAGLIAVVLGLSQIALAGVNQTTKSSDSVKSTKKKKKSKASAPSLVILGVYAQPTVSDLPAASSPVVVTATPPAPPVTRSALANGASVDVHFLLGIQQTGSFKFFVNVEALP